MAPAKHARPRLRGRQGVNAQAILGRLAQMDGRVGALEVVKETEVFSSEFGLRHSDLIRISGIRNSDFSSRLINGHRPRHLRPFRASRLLSAAGQARGDSARACAELADRADARSAAQPADA